MKEFIEVGTTIYSYHIYRNNKNKIKDDFRFTKKRGILTISSKPHGNQICRRITIEFDDKSFTLLGFHYLSKDNDKYLDGYNVIINESKGDGVLLLEDSMETALSCIINHDKYRLAKEEQKLKTLRNKIDIMEKLLTNSILSHGEEDYYKIEISTNNSSDER